MNSTKRLAGIGYRLADIYVPHFFRVPDGWRLKQPEFSVKLSPGKPDNVTRWVDIMGRPVKYNGTAWELVEDYDSGVAHIVGATMLRLGKAARDRLNSENNTSYDSLSDIELGTIRAYTQSYYEDMNAYLRGRHRMDEEDTEIMHNLTKILTHGLKKIPSAEGGLFWRGFVGNPQKSRTVAYAQSLRPGDTYQDLGVGSFTVDKEVFCDFLATRALDRENVVLRVENPHEFKPIHAISKSRSESEYVSLPGAKFRVISNEYTTDERLKISDYIRDKKIRLIELESIKE